MPATSTDMVRLAANKTFQDRVLEKLLAACSTIKAEGWTVPFHRERETFVVAVVNQPATFKTLFANVVATDASVISDATSNGASPIPATDNDAYAAAVTDAHIEAAITADFNMFFRTPGN